MCSVDEECVALQPAVASVTDVMVGARQQGRAGSNGVDLTL